jgi:hypothetical protein
MGFHKRFINRRIIAEVLNREGVSGLIQYMSADALIASADCFDIILLYKEGRWDEINQLVSKEFSKLSK